jgi:hypothetical protein
MTRARLLAGVLMPLWWALSAAGQTPSPHMPTGTPIPGIAAPPANPVASDAPAILHGRVVAADTGIAIRGAVVELHGTGRPGASVNRSAVTNREGRYRFEDIPPGSYAMSATRQGFITMHAGQKRPSERGTFWDVAAGQVQQLDFALPRGSVIFGRLTDDAGEPLAGIHVTTLRVFYSGNGARLRPWTSMPYSGGTDDRGEFRIPGLGPGTYVLAADSQNNALGESYATTYYPGTTNLSEARRFQIGLNEQLSANFSMMTTRQVRVAGQVRSSNGEPLHNYRVLLPGWQLRSVILDGVDITDVPFDASRGGTNKLEIVLTDQRQRLIASVVHNLGKPSERFSVLIFPSTVKEGSVPGRFITLNELTDSTETVEISHLPAGEYYAAAFTRVPDDARFDPGFHEAIKPRATPFQLSPGQTTTLELSLIE